MQDTTIRSPYLKKPDKCSDERELFIDANKPVKFSISYYDIKAYEQWNNSPTEFLPILPWGYHWEKIKNKYGLYQLEYATNHDITLVLYGPDERNKINYNLLVDGNNFYTLAHTRPRNVKRLGPRDRKYPDSIKTDASGYIAKSKHHMPGHCIDHVDTIIPPAKFVKKYGVECFSSYNSRNYIPEIQHDYWGVYMRRWLVEEQRRHGHNYAQFVEYPDKPTTTVSGAAVPESVYFFRLDADYKQEQVCWIDWSEDYNDYKKPSGFTMSEHMEQFSTSLKAAPRPWLWDINFSHRKWIKFVKDKLLLGQDIGNNKIESYDSTRDRLYTYIPSSTIEHTTSYGSVLTALMASSLNKVILATESLQKAVKHGNKLVELDKEIIPVSKKQYELVKKFHEKQKPGFESDEVVDEVKQLSMNQ